jgi:CHAT domain-containing protein
LLIATLREVKPEVAIDLNAAFYENWLAGSNKAEALHKAQVEVRGKTRFAEPRFWAPHALIGLHH